MGNATLQQLSTAEQTILLWAGDPFEHQLLRILSRCGDLVFQAFHRVAAGDDTAAVRAEGDPAALIPGQLGPRKLRAVRSIFLGNQSDAPTKGDQRLSGLAKAASTGPAGLPHSLRPRESAALEVEPAPRGAAGCAGLPRPVLACGPGSNTRQARSPRT